MEQEQGSSKVYNTPEKKKATRSAEKNIAKYTGPTTPRSQSKLARTKYRFGSSNYWKYMYEQSQNVIKEGYEKSLQLEEIPGLLTVNKVKTKEISKTNTRITNVQE